MTPREHAPQTREPLRTDAQLLTALQHLLQRAIQRQIWLFFFDAQQRLIDPIMPLNDHPEDPDELHETADLGLVSFPEVFVRRARSVAEWVEAASFAIVWERPGASRFTRDDLNWARAFIGHAGKHREGASLRAVLLLHDGGLRPITPDDYA